MIHAGRKSRQNGRGQLGWKVSPSAPIHFFFCFPFCSSLLAHCLGWGKRFHPICLDLFPFLCSSRLSFLGSDGHWPRSCWIKCLHNIYKYVEPWWPSVFSVLLISGRSRVRFPAGVDTKIFEVVGNFLTKLFSAGLSKDNSSILLNTRYRAKNNTTTFPYKALHIVELNLGSFPTDGAHFLPNDQYYHLL